MPKPRICIFTETYYPVVGGGETQARALAEGLVAEGYAVMVMTRRSDATLKRVESYGPVTVYRLPPAGRSHFKKWGLLFSSVPRLFSLRRRYDLIFVSGFRVLGIPAVIISRAFRKACILKADSLGEMSGKFFAAGLRKMKLNVSSFAFRLFLAWRNRVLRHADAFVAISTEVSSELRRHGVDPARIHTIPNSVDAQRFCPVDASRKQALREELGLPETARIAVFTGRLVSYKGLPLLLRVWNDLHAGNPNGLLLIVGAGGLDIHNCEDDLKRYAADHNLQDCVRFTGAVQNVHEYLQASDIFVFPTESEAFGISLIEAMACGLPAVSTSIGGVKDILTNEENGLVVEAGDFRQLRDALCKLLQDVSLSDRLGRAARQTVLERYTSTMVTQRYAALFSESTGITA